MFAMVDYNFYIGDKKFDIIMNASGCRCKSKEQIDYLINNGMKTVVSKTCTLTKNIGNCEPNFKEIDDNTCINCLGMPNYGYLYYRELFKEYTKQHVNYIISMDASNWQELREMLLDYNLFVKMHSKTREFVELNVSCPNKTNSTTTSRIIAYDNLEFCRLLENIKGLELNHLHFGLKLSPYVDKIQLEQIANIICNYHHIIKYIVCSNSIPNGMLIDIKTNKPYLSIETGGISGVANKLLGISNVYQFNSIFQKNNTNITILGCGGIENEHDVLEYLSAGAKGVQIGRLLYINGVHTITNIWHNLHSKL